MDEPSRFLNILFVILSGPGADCVRSLCSAPLTSDSHICSSFVICSSSIRGMGYGDTPGKYISLVELLSSSCPLWYFLQGGSMGLLLLIHYCLGQWGALLTAMFFSCPCFL